ncbi:MAG: AraC family transcriptional regulator ligand-binding domain-containing protein [Myxococcota bacterium]
MTCTVIRALAEILDDADVIADAAGLPVPLHTIPEDVADDDAFKRLWRAIMANGDDLLRPLRLGSRLPLGAYGVVDYLTGACPDAGTALEELSRYFGLITPFFTWTVEGEAEPPRVTLLARVGGPEERLVFEPWILGVTVARLQSVVAGGFELLRVELSMPEPTDRAEADAFFGTRVRFGADRALLVVSRASWQAPLSRREPRLRDVLARHADALLRQVRPDDGLAPVRKAIQNQLPQGPPTLGGVAKALAKSSRTLQRRLSEAGTSFQTLVDEERNAAARAYLADPRLGLDEVAFLLGFSEASAFSRAFKRWTGMSPTQYRA